MKILFILPSIPYPLQSGGNQAFYNMVDAIRHEHNVSIIACGASSADYIHAEELQKLWPDVCVDLYTPKKATAVSEVVYSHKDAIKYRLFSFLEASMKRKKARIVRRYETSCKDDSRGNALGRFVRQHSVLYNESNTLTPEFLEYIHEKCRQGFDMVQVEFFECLPVVYALPAEVHKVFVHHELRFVRNENETSLFDDLSLKDRIRLQKQKDEELSALAHYDDIIVLTETDRRILTEYIPHTNIYVSPALTNAAVNDTSVSYRTAHDLVFLGGSDHFPNRDGIMWFAMEVMPELRSLAFDGSIFVTGKWSEEAMKEVRGVCPEINFVGFVDSLHEFVNGKITIVPIRIGSGMRMKLIDAMAAKSPIVTTSKGCEGLPFVDGKNCYVADDAKNFAEDIISLQRNIDLQKTMVEACSDNMSGILDSKHLLETRLEFYRHAF